MSTIRAILIGALLFGISLFPGCGGSSASDSTSNTDTSDAAVETFTLTSDAASDGGALPADYTCDGSGASPALSWSGSPAGTVEFALIMSTEAPDGTKYNWVLYHIPAAVSGLEKNSSGAGTAGAGSHGGAPAYEPPCSQGPGDKFYTFTLYALSQAPELPDDAAQVTGDALATAISGTTLGSASLTLSYARP
jgi:phosphatidylethanolamine-binding protein (PEBP) family uncharacterized protein